MRRFLMFVVLMSAAFAASAQAGTVNYTGGHGSWQSEKCTPPQMPSSLAKDPEAAANNLNEQINAHNLFVAASQDYMNCVSQEAQRDSDATSQIIMHAAQALIQKAQADVAASAAALQAKSGK
jgi:hypothetical protein